MTTNGVATEYLPTDDLINTLLLERISTLELQLENSGWIRNGDIGSDTEFSLPGIKAIARMARLYCLKNPLIGRGVNVQSDYTFGRGVNVNAKDEDINVAVQQFLDDPQNQVELTSHQAMLQKDRELQCDGNIFLVFFVNPSNGHIRVRSIPLEEIDDIITNPDDKKQPWYYRRVWTQKTFDVTTGEYKHESKKAYYRDWRHIEDKNTAIAGVPIETPVIFHIKSGGFSDWKFGLCEFYSAIDWAKAYKSFLENWATLMQAYARFAMQLKTKGGSSAVSAAKTRLSTTLTTDNVERNPPANTGSTFIGDADKVALDVVKTAGATTKAEEGRRLGLMVAAGQGLPETFYGDVSVGTLATAESLDRPTELKFSNKQEFWQAVFKQIIWYVIEQSVRAVNGVLRSIATVVTNVYGEEIVEFADGIDTRINVDFPEILSISIKDLVSAIISVATLDGKQLTLLDARTATELLLNALGLDDVDEIIKDLFDNESESQESRNFTGAINNLIEALKDRG